MKYLIILAGYGQMALALASLALPGLMNWKTELSRISVLFRQMFWTYAGYIFFINLFWGILSVVAYESLMDGSPAAVIITAFIALYWAGRIVIQFSYFDRKAAPKGAVCPRSILFYRQLP